MGLLTRALPARSAIAAALLAAASLSARPACAQSDDDRLKARELGDQGKAALARKDYAAAADLFRKASARVAAPTLEIGLARAEVGLGHLVAARGIYARLTEKPPDASTPPAFAKAMKEAVAEFAALELRIPSVTITLRGPRAGAATVTLDGVPLTSKEAGEKQLVDPGPHRAHAAAPDFEPADATFTATEGASSAISLELVPVVRRASAQRSFFGFGLLGLGAGALGLGGAMGALALRDRSALFSACPDGRCNEPQRGRLEAYHRESAIAWPALGTGAAAIGAGTALLVTSDRHGALLPGKIGPALLGAGVAGITLGAVTGIVALQSKPDAAATCAPPTCQDRIDSYHEIGTASLISLAAGGAAGISGALLVALVKDTPPPPVTPAVGPGGISVSGRF